MCPFVKLRSLWQNFESCVFFSQKNPEPETLGVRFSESASISAGANTKRIYFLADGFIMGPDRLFFPPWQGDWSKFYCVWEFLLCRYAVQKVLVHGEAFKSESPDNNRWILSTDQDTCWRFKSALSILDFWFFFSLIRFYIPRKAAKETKQGSFNKLKVKADTNKFDCWPLFLPTCGVDLGPPGLHCGTQVIELWVKLGSQNVLTIVQNVTGASCLIDKPS